jgi:hypothetical protein
MRSTSLQFLFREIYDKNKNAKVKLENGKLINADALGNNIAIICPSCLQFPILLIALTNQKGSDTKHPSICKNCGKKYCFGNKLDNGLNNVIIKELY